MDGSRVVISRERPPLAASSQTPAHRATSRSSTRRSAASPLANAMPLASSLTSARALRGDAAAARASSRRRPSARDASSSSSLPSARRVARGRSSPAVRASGSPFDKLEIWDAERAECALAEGGTAVVSFGTTWCGPCAVLKPELEQLARAMDEMRAVADVVVAKLDAEEAPALASAHAVGAYPTTLWLREGAEVHRLEGSLPASALVQLTAMHLLDAEAEEFLRAEQPKWFAPTPLEPMEMASASRAAPGMLI